MDWLSVGIDILGVPIGVAGLVYAHIANCKAKKSNSIAKRALQEAAESNRIAIQANKLAEDANSVSERALRVSSEDFEYNWGFRIENDGVICISSESSHDAVDFTLLVEVQHAGKSIAPADAHYRHVDNVSYGAQLFFKIESIYPQLIPKARAQKRHIVAMFGDSVVYNGRNPITFDVIAVMAWKTPGGGERGGTIKRRLSCREDKLGAIVFSQVS